MAAITSANVANAIVKLVAVDALPALMGNLVMGNLVNRDFEPALAQAGDTVNVPIPPALVANNLAEGGTVQTQNPSLGNAQIVLNTHAEATFQIPDVTKVLAVPDLLQAVHAAGGGGAGREDRERSAGPVRRASRPTRRWARRASAITEAVVDAAETALFEAKVPASEPKYLVVDAATYSQLRQIPRFSEFQTAGDAGPAGAGGRHGREDQGLLRVPVAVREEDGERSGDDAQPGVRAERASAWWSAGCRSRCRARARSPSTPSWATSACGW